MPINLFLKKKIIAPSSILARYGTDKAVYEEARHKDFLGNRGRSIQGF
jgi:hypothetical protein